MQEVVGDGEDARDPDGVPIEQQSPGAHSVDLTGPPTRDTPVGNTPLAPLFDSPELQPFAAMTLEQIARAADLKTIHVVAWRDYDDEEAGGSELHAHRILAAWARAGIDVVMTTSAVEGASSVVSRDGYRVTRRLGRYKIFPRTIISGFLGHLGQVDGVVEIWNGMPFFSPVWARCPNVVFLHHVHGEMWQMVLPGSLAAIGHTIEHRLAPPFYRNTPIITLSHSSKEEIVDQLGVPAEHVSVSPPGVEPRYSPGTTRSDVPLVVAVGRLVPVKRFELTIEAALRLKVRHPDLTVVIAGEGYERPKLEALIRRAGADDWIHLPGFVSDEDLVELYRSAWVLTSGSLREGWGMTVTEAGACGTPAVVTRISGHLDAVVDGETGFLVDDLDQMVDSLDLVLNDEVLRKRLAVAALEHASRFRWEETARQTLAVLAAEVLSRRDASGHRKRRRRSRRPV